MVLFNSRFDRMRSIAVQVTTFLYLFRLGLHLGFAHGFIVIVDNDPSIQRKMATKRMKIAMPSSTSMAMPECDKGEMRISDKNDFVCEDSPLCPSSYPSKTFSASNIRVSHQQLETDENNGVNGLQLLPLQRYHSQTRKLKDSRRRIRMGEGTETNTSILGKTHKVAHDIPNLDYICENKSRFQITKSSQVLLEE